MCTFNRLKNCNYIWEIIIVHIFLFSGIWFTFGSSIRFAKVSNVTVKRSSYLALTQEARIRFPKDLLLLVIKSNFFVSTYNISKFLQKAYVIDWPKRSTNDSSDASNIISFINIIALIDRDIISSIIAKSILSTRHRANTPSLTRNHWPFNFAIILKSRNLISTRNVIRDTTHSSLLNTFAMLRHYYHLGYWILRNIKKIAYKICLFIYNKFIYLFKINLV